MAPRCTSSPPASRPTLSRRTCSTPVASSPQSWSPSRLVGRRRGSTSRRSCARSPASPPCTRSPRGASPSASTTPSDDGRASMAERAACTTATCPGGRTTGGAPCVSCTTRRRGPERPTCSSAMCFGCRRRAPRPRLARTSSPRAESSSPSCHRHARWFASTMVARRASAPRPSPVRCPSTAWSVRGSASPGCSTPARATSTSAALLSPTCSPAHPSAPSSSRGSRRWPTTR